MDTRLFTYKLTHDTGFAPNPFGGILTLANCKPLIRKYKKIGQWIAGFTSNDLNKNLKRQDYNTPRLVYLMQVTDKISFEKYWNDEKYDNRKPKNIKSNIIMERIGDNIYKPLKSNALLPNDFEQIENTQHNGGDLKKTDLSGEYILISNKFYYFGDNPLKISYDILPKIPKTQAGHGVEGFKNDNKKKKAFLSYIQSNYKIGIHAKPHNWFKNDKTYKLDPLYVGEK